MLIEVRRPPAAQASRSPHPMRRPATRAPIRAHPVGGRTGASIRRPLRPVDAADATRMSTDTAALSQNDPMKYLPF